MGYGMLYSSPYRVNNYALLIVLNPPYNYTPLTIQTPVPHVVDTTPSRTHAFFKYSLVFTAIS